MNVKVFKILLPIVLVVSVTLFIAMYYRGRIVSPAASNSVVEASALPTPSTNFQSTTITQSTLINHSQFTTEVGKKGGPFCEVPLSGIRGWNDGVVTVLRPVVERNCTKIFAGDKKAVVSVGAKNRKWRNALTDGELLNMTKNCTWVRDYFHGNLYTTKLERSFPIAFTFVVYNSPQQVLRLIKFLYRPKNTYCIHPDTKSSKMFHGIFSNIAGCLENVIIPSKLVKVSWGDHSIMEAQMRCLSGLVHRRYRQPEQEKWRYVINLCGKELPLSSTHSIVSHLTKLNGSSAINAIKVTPADKKVFRKRLRGKKTPFNLPLYKSMTYMAISHEFAHYLITNSTAIKLREFFVKCRHSEEHFYATLYMIPGVPGGFNANIPYFDIARAFWLYAKHTLCWGLNVHHICIVTVGDLKRVVGGNKRALFHNKYFMEQDHTIMDCMEERLVARNKREFEEDCSP